MNHLSPQIVSPAVHLFVELDVFPGWLLAFLSYLPQHVVNEPLFLIPIPLTPRRPLETRLQHGLSPPSEIHTHKPLLSTVINLLNNEFTHSMTRSNVHEV